MSEILVKVHWQNELLPVSSTAEFVVRRVTEYDENDKPMRDCVRYDKLQWVDIYYRILSDGHGNYTLGDGLCYPGPPKLKLMDFAR